MKPADGVNLAALVDRLCKDARRRLYKEIDRRAELALGQRARSTVNRSVGQRYKRTQK